ncbi:MAG: hypothetical protein LBJ80_00145 [Rickettsiales bacterium]|jgi:hypothetical protein|nr:hypothetical protein [Rickettsiales bacterium]
MSGSINQDALNPLLTGDIKRGLDENREWELNQKWLAPGESQTAEQAMAISNVAGVTNQQILHNDELDGNNDAMGGSSVVQNIQQGLQTGATAGGTVIGGIAGNPYIGSALGGAGGSAMSTGLSGIGAAKASSANKKYMDNPTLENEKKAAKADYWTGNVDMDVYNALMGSGPSKYYVDKDRQELLRKQVVMGANDRVVTNYGGNIN